VRDSLKKFDSLADFYSTLLPAYQFVHYSPLYARVNGWESKLISKIRAINPKRASDRFNNYVSPGELDRVRRFTPFIAKRGTSIRLGHSKPGLGMGGGERDFCILGAVVRRRALTVMYRSIDLIGGLAYDLTLFDSLGESLGVRWSSLTVFAMTAETQTSKGTSNEKLYPKLRRILNE